MSAVWEPERQTARLRNGTVVAKGTDTVDISMGSSITRGVPVYGAVADVGTKVLVFEQGGSLLVLSAGVVGVTVTVGTSPPANPRQGDIWVNTS